MVDSKVQKISSKDLKVGDLILDVRTREELAQKVLSIPFIHEDSAKINIDSCIKKYNLDGRKTLNILCLSGIRATEVAEKFIKNGFTNVKVVNGGIIQAEKEGLKIIVKK
ncbi:MAG: rhodanese-like domain-containing protein [Rickettsiales bacterium]|nr:rhodanese-like domain-containing protein [Rickettsiales bacterium]